MQATQKEMMYEGKGKKLYKTEDKGLIISQFKDDLTAFNAEKKGSEQGKGILNCKISTEIFKLLEKNGVKTHYVETIGEDLMLCKLVQIIPIEVVVRNVATGSLTKRLGIKEGESLPFTLVEFYYKDDALGDPLINDYHALALKLATPEEIETIKRYAFQVNDFLKAFWASCGVTLVDFKLEFGRLEDGTIVLADEISPDTCRLWDSKTHEKLDKDRFRRDLGGVEDAYAEVMRRMTEAL